MPFLAFALPAASMLHGIYLQLSCFIAILLEFALYLNFLRNSVLFSCILYPLFPFSLSFYTLPIFYFLYPFLLSFSFSFLFTFYLIVFCFPSSLSLLLLFPPSLLFCFPFSSHLCSGFS